MPLYKGSSKIESIYRSSRSIPAIYRAVAQVFPDQAPTPPFLQGTCIIPGKYNALVIHNEVEEPYMAVEDYKLVTRYCDDDLMRVDILVSPDAGLETTPDFTTEESLDWQVSGTSIPLERLDTVETLFPETIAEQAYSLHHVWAVPEGYFRTFSIPEDGTPEGFSTFNYSFKIVFREPLYYKALNAYYPDPLASNHNVTDTYMFTPLIGYRNKDNPESNTQFRYLTRSVKLYINGEEVNYSAPGFWNNFPRRRNPCGGTSEYINSIQIVSECYLPEGAISGSYEAVVCRDNYFDPSVDFHRLGFSVPYGWENTGSITADMWRDTGHEYEKEKIPVYLVVTRNRINETTVEDTLRLLSDRNMYYTYDSQYLPISLGEGRVYGNGSCTNYKVNIIDGSFDNNPNQP